MKKDMLLLLCLFVVAIVGFGFAVFSVAKVFVSSVNNVMVTYDIIRE